jgi:hypothetical protein
MLSEESIQATAFLQGTHLEEDGDKPILGLSHAAGKLMEEKGFAAPKVTEKNDEAPEGSIEPFPHLSQGISSFFLLPAEDGEGPHPLVDVEAWRIDRIDGEFLGLLGKVRPEIDEALILDEAHQVHAPGGSLFEEILGYRSAAVDQGRDQAGVDASIPSIHIAQEVLKHLSAAIVLDRSQRKRLCNVARPANDPQIISKRSCSRQSLDLRLGFSKAANRLDPGEKIVSMLPDQAIFMGHCAEGNGLILERRSDIMEACWLVIPPPATIFRSAVVTDPSFFVGSEGTGPAAEMICPNLKYLILVRDLGGALVKLQRRAAGRKHRKARMNPTELAVVSVAVEKEVDRAL